MQVSGTASSSISISAVATTVPVGVVWISDERNFRLVGDRCSERREIKGLIVQRNPNLLGFDEASEDWICLKRRPTHRHGIAGSDVGEQDLLQDPCRTSAYRHLVACDIQVRGKLRPQCGGSVIGGTG